jgi:hypothetical protein
MNGINDFITKTDVRIEEMEIVSINPTNWKIRVGILGAASMAEYQYTAVLLSPIPQGEDGSGLFAVPKIGDSCTVLLSTTGGRTVAYILGFRAYPNQATGGSGGVEPKTGLEQGDTLLMNRIGMIFKMGIRGGFHFIADSWAKLMIGVTNQEIRGWFRNAYFRARGGRVEWETSRETEASQYMSVITDKFEHDRNSDARVAEAVAPIATLPGGETPVYANKEIRKVGSWGENVPFSTRELRAGARISGDLPNRLHKTEEVIPDGPEKRTMLSGPNGSMVFTYLDEEAKFKGEIYNETTAASGLSSPYCTFLVNPYSLSVSHTGDMSVHCGGDVLMAASGAVTIGGDGEEQQLVTKTFVEEIYMMHNHMGNNGAPTSMPLNNAEIVEPASRDEDNHFTKDTTAE